MPSRVAISAVVLATLTACTAPTPGRAVPEQPPPFPDFDRYPSADIADYEFTNWHDDRLAGFRTSGGVSCVANIYNGGLNNFSCHASPMPGFPDGRALGWNSLTGGYEFRQAADRDGDEFRVLPGGQSLIVGNTGCAVGDDESVSCIDGSHHGFVIAEAGSTTF